MKCEVCGTVNNVGDAFCHNCGAFLQPNAGGETVQNVVPNVNTNNNVVGNNEVINQYQINNDVNNNMNQNNNSSSLIMDSVYDNTNNNTNNQYGSMNTQLNYNTDMYNNPSNNVSDQTINYNDITPQAMNDLSNQNSSYVPISESQVVDDGKPHMSGNIIKIVVAVIIIIALVLVFIFLVLPLMKNDKKEETPTPTPTVVTEERTLGDEDHGYITVSGVWNEESEDNKLIYKNESDEVITLDFSNSSSAISWVSSERSSFENMQLTRDTINGYNAYVIKGNVGELYKIVYIFEDMNGISHYISGEGLNEESNIFNVLNTYTLKK